MLATVTFITLHGASSKLKLKRENNELLHIYQGLDRESENFLNQSVEQLQPA